MFSVARNEKLKFKARPKKAQISSLLFPECFKICPCTSPNYENGQSGLSALYRCIPTRSPTYQNTALGMLLLSVLFLPVQENPPLVSSLFCKQSSSTYLLVLLRCFLFPFRAVGRSEHPGVEIGLTDLQKSGTPGSYRPAIARP